MNIYLKVLLDAKKKRAKELALGEKINEWWGRKYGKEGEKKFLKDGIHFFPNSLRKKMSKALEYELNKKIQDIFGPSAVNKKHALMKEVSRLPRFIGEYLITQFIKEDEVDTTALGNHINK